MRQQMWEAVLSSDSFRDSNCEKCGHQAAAFALTGGPGGLASLCPNCVVERIDGLEERHGNIPATIACLREEAKRETVKQAGEKPPNLFETYSDFARCDRCSKLIYSENAVQRDNRIGGSDNTHCADCAHELEELDVTDATESETARKNVEGDSDMDHSEFIKAYKSGSLKVHVIRNASGYLYEQEGLILEKYRTLQAVIRSLFFGGVIAGVGLFFFVEWYVALAVLASGFFMSRVATHFAAKGVLQTALVRPSFYKAVTESGILRVEKVG